MLHLAVLGSTKGTDLEAVVQAIQEKKLTAQIDFVLSDRETAFILERARKHNLNAIFLNPQNKSREQFCSELIQLLDDYKIDLVLLIGFMRILTPNFVSKYGLRCMNIHPSLLPAFAGGMDKSVHQAVLDAGVNVTGCTLHFICEQADEGPIILQKKVKVLPDDTVDSLKERVQSAEQETILKGIELFQLRKLKIEQGKVKILE